MFICNFYKIGGVLCKMYSACAESTCVPFFPVKRQERSAGEEVLTIAMWNTIMDYHD